MYRMEGKLRCCWLVTFLLSAVRMAAEVQYGYVVVAAGIGVSVRGNCGRLSESYAFPAVSCSAVVVFRWESQLANCFKVLKWVGCTVIASILLYE
ncbi:hypothetical protein CEXT_659301 [Caerostris extrusa]|uniref:Secreted protein n=1 Tax=Caerostris extrusa TaxID=172846 RepID=A0AAV4XNC2_CAEEX|nr:hypothetical protein CEXT_659301 [Caerostris extrusa]